MRPRLVWICIALGYVLVVALLGHIWYAQQMRPSFHFFNDLHEWKQLDKLAHCFCTFHLCAVIMRLLKWAGVINNILVSTFMGLLMTSSIEVLDGFSIGYGASVFDILANAIGSMFFFGQMHFWKKINWVPKFSFHFTKFATIRPSMLGDGWLSEIIKDYNGQTFWYSYTPSVKWWPSFLSLSIGLGAEGMIYGLDTQNEQAHFNSYRKCVLSLDLNPYYFRRQKKAYRLLFYPLSAFKCPAPAIELSVYGVRFHWLYV